MHYLIGELEELGYAWAYRTVDSRFTGVPQRRRRVILLASVDQNPGDVLFVDDSGEPPTNRYRDDAFGFYWTEGLRGLGWAVDAVPTLKGGSTLGIPSPPAVWVPGAPVGRQLVWPNIRDAENLQGFESDWTLAASDGRRDGDRWKLVGNAVTVGVSKWVASRLREPGTDRAPREEIVRGWPTAAAGAKGERRAVRVSEYPTHEPYRHILDVLDTNHLRPMSLRATRGFFNRLNRGNLGKFPGFREAVALHLEAMEGELGSAIA
jgi:DNA (cytosine-5)-methyltransferase 1